MNTVKDLLIWGRKKVLFLRNPQLEVEVLLCAVLDCERAWLKAHGEYELSEAQYAQFKDYIAQREHRMPVAYILGYKDWCEMRLRVNEATLIPRDETEVLCGHVVKDLKIREYANVRVLDVGTGSGAIACFFAQKLENGIVTALDISSEALEVAKENAKNLKLNINFVQSDLLSAIDDEGFFDIIVANLPYVPDDLSVSEEVQKEPGLALFSGEDGLAHYRLLGDQLTTKKIRFLALWIEFLPQQQNEIRNIFSPYSVEFFTDSGSEVFFAKIS